MKFLESIAKEWVCPLGSSKEKVPANVPATIVVNIVDSVSYRHGNRTGARSLASLRHCGQEAGGRGAKAGWVQ